MPSNSEIKARVTDPAALRRRLEALTGGNAQLLIQEDVFFRVPSGRLKLRTFDEHTGERIAYQRQDRDGPRLSTYTIAPTSNPAGLRRILNDVLGVTGIVRKQRELFLIGATRVHLDRVEGLGDFVELEVVLQEGQSEADGERIARALMADLKIAEDSLIAGAYIDLLTELISPGGS